MRCCRQRLKLSAVDKNTQSHCLTDSFQICPDAGAVTASVLDPKLVTCPSWARIKVGRKTAHTVPSALSPAEPRGPCSHFWSPIKGSSSHNFSPVTSVNQVATSEAITMTVPDICFLHVSCLCRKSGCAGDWMTWSSWSLGPDKSTLLFAAVLSAEATTSDSGGHHVNQDGFRSHSLNHDGSDVSRSWHAELSRYLSPTL